MSFCENRNDDNGISKFRLLNLGTWKFLDTHTRWKFVIFCEILNREWHFKSRMVMNHDGKVTLFMKTEWHLKSCGPVVMPVALARLVSYSCQFVIMWRSKKELPCRLCKHSLSFLCSYPSSLLALTAQLASGFPSSCTCALILILSKLLKIREYINFCFFLVDKVRVSLSWRLWRVVIF